MPSLRIAATVAACVAALAGAATASAGPIAFSTCPSRAPVQCGTLVVPLDRADPAKGTLSLHVERLPARQSRRGTMVLLAGGPGQAGTPMSPNDSVAAAIPGWDFVMLDQRGTGKGALRCAALDAPGAQQTPEAVGQCAAQVGPKRAFYATRDSVLDLEDLRTGLGTDTFALGGVSYGTYVAQYYAQMFPTRLSHLVLDSVVNPAGMNGFDQASYAALTPSLSAMCAGARCKGITPDPVADVATLAKMTATTALRGRRTTLSGTVVRSSLGGPGNQGDLMGLLVDQDLAITTRALWPGAARAATKGDVAPLLRLATLLLSGGSSSPSELSNALFWSTACADYNLPWNSGTPFEQRPAAARAAAEAIGTGFAPFGPENALALSLEDGCARWPDAATDPLTPAPLPAVPTLVLTGGQDLRTPSADALAVAARAPASSVVVAPGAGHSLLGSYDCANDQLRNLLYGRPVSTTACRKDPRLPWPSTVPPATLGAVSPSGAPGTAGRVAHAARLAVIDGVDALPAADEVGAPALPGIRGGTARQRDLLGGVVAFSRFSAVQGVSITGTIRFNGKTFQGALKVNGPGAWDGVLTLAPGGERAYRGSIGGVPVRIPLR